MAHATNYTRTYFSFMGVFVLIAMLFSTSTAFGQNELKPTSASYSAATHTITLSFDSQVYAQNTLLGLIEVDDDNGGINENLQLDTATVVNSGLTQQVQIDLVRNGDLALLQDFEGLNTDNLQIIADEGAFLGSDSLTYSAPVTLNDNLMIIYNDFSGRTSLVSAAYDAYLNQMDLVFTRPLLMSKVNELALSIQDAAGGRVSFQGAVDFLPTGQTDTLKMDFNSRLAQLIEQLDLNSLMLTGPKWSFVDTSYRSVAAFNSVDIAATPDTAIAFELKAAKYNTLKNSLELGFSRKLKFKSLVANRLTVTAGGESASLIGQSRATYVDTTVTFTLIREDQNRMEDMLNAAGGSFVLSVGEFAVLDAEGNGNIESQVDGILADTLDAGTPIAMDTVKYNAQTNELSIPFNQRMGTEVLYEGIHIVNSATQDTLTLREPLEVNRANILQTLILTLDSRDAYQIESFSASDKTNNLSILLDPFSVFDLINKNGNSSGFLPIQYSEDSVAPNLVEFFYNTESGTAVFTFDRESVVAGTINSGEVEIGGVTVTGVDSVSNPEPNTIALHVNSETADNLTLSSLSTEMQQNLLVGFNDNVFENLDNVAAMGMTDVGSDSLNPAGDEINVGYGRKFWLKSYEAFAPAPVLHAASIRGIGNILRVYVGNTQWADGNVTHQEVDTLIARFESDSANGIYNFVTETLGLEPIDTDNDPHINILFADILDEYDLGRNDANDNLYIHGYYTPEDTLSSQEYQYSNQADLIYLDCNPQTVTGSDFSATGFNAITNEFTKMLMVQNRPHQERWIREGLATMMEFGVLDGNWTLYGDGNFLKTPSTNQLTYIEGSLKTRIDQANAFLFHLYLYEKYGGYDILKAVAQSDSVGISAISDALQATGATQTAKQVFSDYSVACFLDLPQANDAYNGKYSFENVSIDDSPVNKNATPLDWDNVTTAQGVTSEPYPQSQIQPWSFNFYASIAYSLDLQGNPSPKSPHLDADGSFQFNGRDDSDFRVNKVMLRSTYLEQMDPGYDVSSMDISGEGNVGTIPVSSNSLIFDNGTANQPVPTDSSAALAFLIVSKTDNAPPSGNNDFVISNITDPPSYADFLATQLPTNNRYLKLYVISQREIYNPTGTEGPIIQVWTDADTLAGEVRNLEDITLEKLFSQSLTQHDTSVVYKGSYEFVYDQEYTYEFRFIGQDLSGNSAGGESLNITAMKYDNKHTVSINLPDKDGSMTIPAKAAETTYLTATRLNPNVSFAPARFVKPKTSDKLQVVSDPFFFGPVNLALKKPASVTLPYNARIEQPERLGIYYLNGDKWEYIGGKVDTKSKTITAKTKNLGYFVLKSGAHPDTPLELQIPDQFALFQNYPNPFNPTTQIRYALAEDARVTLSVYNLLGQRIATLVNTSQSAGYHSIEWDATNDQGAQISSGVYFIQIQTPQFTANKKMVYLR